MRFFIPFIVVILLSIQLSAESEAIFLRLNKSLDDKDYYLLEIFHVSNLKENKKACTDEKLLQEMKKSIVTNASIRHNTSGNKDGNKKPQEYFNTLMNAPVSVDKKLFLIKPDYQLDASESKTPVPKVFDRVCHDFKLTVILKKIKGKEKESLDLDYSCRFETVQQNPDTLIPPVIKSISASSNISELETGKLEMLSFYHETKEQ